MCPHDLGVDHRLAHTECMNTEGGFERSTRDELLPSEFDLDQHVSALSPVVQSSARSAAVLLLPTTFGDQYPGGCFPESTPGVFRSLREHLPEGVTVEAAVDDEDYEEYAFRSIDLILPVLLIADQTMINVVTTVLVDYVRDLFSRGRSEGAYVRSHIHVVVAPDGSKTLCHSYEGPAETFERAIAKLPQLIDGHLGTAEACEDPSA